MEETEAAEVARRVAERAGIEVRSLTKLPELRAIRDLYTQIWSGRANPLVTMDQLRAMTHAGNYAAGAFDGGTLVGATVGFFAAPPGRALHSHITGVMPNIRARNVGFALKLHQRAWALERGLAEVTWTFDPLVRRNAYFNLVKLGGRPREYLVDFYGDDLDDAINRGQGSDRLLLAWDLGSPVVAAACAGRPAESNAGSPAASLASLDRSDALARGISPAVALSVSVSGAPRPAPEAQWRGANTVLVEIPADIEALRVKDSATARAWRMAVRETLGELLAGGAAVTGFSRSGGYVVEWG